MTGDPLADALVGLVLGLVDEGIHALDPAARALKARAAVDDALARLRAADPGPLAARLDAQEQARRAQLERDADGA